MPLRKPRTLPKAADGPAALEVLARLVGPLTAATEFSRPLGRRRFAFALLVALVPIAIGRIMDVLVFAPGGEVPAFYLLAATALIAGTLPALCVRRLRDAGTSRWAALLVLAPVVGWIALAWLLSRPSTQMRRTSS